MFGGRILLFNHLILNPNLFYSLFMSSVCNLYYCQIYEEFLFHTLVLFRYYYFQTLQLSLLSKIFIFLLYK